MTSHTIATRTGTIAETLLVASVLLFIFSGFYKELVAPPIDLTVLAAGLTCAALIPFLHEVDVHRHAATWLLVALTSYLAIRLLPDPSAWGARKLAEATLFGAPAFFAGYVIAKRNDAINIMIAVLSYAAPPVAVALAIISAATDPYVSHWIGSAGYQLTGVFMGLSLIAAAVSNRYICFGFAALGLAVSGSLTAAVFSPIAVALIWWQHRDYIAKQAATAIALLAIYSLLVAPPLIVMRALWKIGAIETTITLGDKAPRYGGAALTEKIIAAIVEKDHRYKVDNLAADRLDIFADAWRKFLQAPIFGNGYGQLDYLGNRNAHNVILEMLAEGGLIAAVLFMAVLAFSLPRPYGRSDVYALASLVILIGGAMFGGYWGNRILLLFIGMAVGLRPRKP